MKISASAVVDKTARHLGRCLVGSILMSAACGGRTGLDTLNESVGGMPSFGGLPSTGGAPSTGGVISTVANRASAELQPPAAIRTLAGLELSWAWGTSVEKLKGTRP